MRPRIISNNLNKLIGEVLLATKTINLKYTTVAGFLRDYAQLRKGRLVLPVNLPPPLNTRICLKVSAPDIELELTLKGTVINTFAPRGASRLQRPGILHIGFNGGSREAIRNFDKILCRHEKYRARPNLTAPEGSGRTDAAEASAAKMPEPPSIGSGTPFINGLRTALDDGNVPASKGAAARHRPGTTEIVADVRANLRRYVEHILGVKSTDDAVVLLKLFRRVLPDLIRQADWSTVLHLTRAVDLAAKTTVFFAAAPCLPANPLEFVFLNRSDDIVKAYAAANADRRKMIHQIAGRLDDSGTEIMVKMLSACPDDGVRKAAMSFLMKKGDQVRNWILAALDAPDQKWHLKRTALRLLNYVGKKEEEIDRARRLIDHDHPRVREEALNVLITLQAVGAEELIIAALNDTDGSVRRRAVSCLARLSPISESVVKCLLARISDAAAADRNGAAAHHRQTANLIKALAAAPGMVQRVETESIILALARKISYHQRGVFRRFKKTIDPDQSDVLAAAIETLGRIGADKSESFLEKLAGSKLPQAESAQAAANQIKLRYIAMLSNAPDDAAMAAIA
jgi:HEAT repeat protein